MIRLEKKNLSIEDIRLMERDKKSYLVFDCVDNYDNQTVVIEAPIFLYKFRQIIGMTPYEIKVLIPKIRQNPGALLDFPGALARTIKELCPFRGIDEQELRKIYLGSDN